MIKKKTPKYELPARHAVPKVHVIIVIIIIIYCSDIRARFMVTRNNKTIMTRVLQLINGPIRHVLRSKQINLPYHNV